MQSFSFNILDIDGNDDMFNDIRKCLQISPSLMDGHCFLYSIVKSCHSQLTPSCDMNVAFILRKMRSELTTSPDEYTGFKIDSDIIAVKTALNYYAFDKKYNTYFGDTVPLLCANSLGISIGVLDDSHNSSSKVIFSRNKTKACVFIRKNGDHYDGLIPMKHMCDNLREPLWQSGQAHRKGNAQKDDFDSKYYVDDEANLQLLKLPPSDDTSVLNDDKPDDVLDFLYRLKIHRKAHPTNLLTGSLNINSIRNKFSTVDHILRNAYVNIFGICDTKLDHTFPEGQFHVTNYTYHRKDRSSNGGGLMMYFRSDIPQRRRYDLEKVLHCGESGLEIMIIETVMNDKECWIYVMSYKPPDVRRSVFIEAFSSMCDLILKESNNVIILGDYNCNFISDNALKDICISFNMHNLVSAPTCHKTKHPCPENFERYRVLRNKCVKAKLKSQREYFAERCDGGPKNQHFWPMIKPFINSKCHVQENIILRAKDDIVNDTKSVAKIFNEYFTGIASDIGFNDPIPDDYGKDEVLISLIAKYDNHPSIIAIQSAVLEHGTFEFEQVDINQIYQILVNMNDKKATGYDGIPCKLLKLDAFPLAGILCKLINISISECKFPDVLKLADISALFKKIDRLCKDNYRPVSILTALSKVFERCHSNQLLFYFEKLFSKFYLGLEKVTAVKVHC